MVNARDEAAGGGSDPKFSPSEGFREIARTERFALRLFLYLYFGAAMFSIAKDGWRDNVSAFIGVGIGLVGLASSVRDR